MLLKTKKNQRRVKKQEETTMNSGRVIPQAVPVAGCKKGNKTIENAP